MRRALLLLLILLPLRLLAQEHHRLAGFVQTTGEPLISYYLELTIKGTEITGYSITDYSGGNRLKASVVGRREPMSDIYIEETGSLDGPNSRLSVYCYFSAHLKLTVNNGKQRWSGAFVSRNSDGSLCNPAGGLMTIIDDAPPLDAPEPPKPKPVPLPRPQMRIVDTVKPKPKPIPAPAPIPRPIKDTLKLLPKKIGAKPPVIITIPPKAIPTTNDSCARIYDWQSENLTFDLSDGWTIDGDVISIAVGERTILDHVKLSEVKQHYTVPLTRGLNTLTVSFWEEGADPPNTPAITLYDGDRKYPLDISGEYGQKLRICFVRK